LVAYYNVCKRVTNINKGGSGVEIEYEHGKSTAQPNILTGVLRILAWIAIVVLLSIAAGALPLAER
jgi:hypothetical protein